MEVKPGYKQTEVGVIPKEWSVKSLRACLKKRFNVVFMRVCGA